MPHPSDYLVNYPDRDYFAVTQYSETFTFAGQEGTLTYWHRPLHAMTDAFTDAGFQICEVSEPPYAVDTPSELLPPALGIGAPSCASSSSSSKHREGPSRSSS